MSVDIVYTSCRRDLAWLCYSIQLLQKNLEGDYGIVVRVDKDCHDVTETWDFKDVRYHYVEPWPDSYNFHMYLKSTADEYSSAAALILVDSDHLLLEKAKLEQFFDHGLPIIRYREWTDDPDLKAVRKIWAPPVERTLGIALDRDYMLGPPFVFWRETFVKMRKRVEEVVGKPFREAVYSDRPYSPRTFFSHPMTFCDYEALGLYAKTFEPERYSFHPYPDADPWPFKVYWSHGDWTAKLQAQLDALLGL